MKTSVMDVNSYATLKLPAEVVITRLGGKSDEVGDRGRAGARNVGGLQVLW